MLRAHLKLILDDESLDHLAIDVGDRGAIFANNASKY